MSTHPEPWWLVGASTPSGHSLVEQWGRLPSRTGSLTLLSRDPAETLRHHQAQPALTSLQADLTDPAALCIQEQPSVILSLGPIWHLAPFLGQLFEQQPDQLRQLRAVIACSSSSAETKRFAANRYDKALVQRLTSAEEQLAELCRTHQLSGIVVRPTLIYGRSGPYQDRNLSRLIEMMRRLPCLPLPASSGLRQPIHCGQLAAVLLHGALQTHQLASRGTLTTLSLGGDDCLSYESMLIRLQQALPEGDRGRRCSLLRLPNRLLTALAAPLALRSPSGYEALLRMGADLAGFTPVQALLQVPPQSFPLEPLAR